MQEKGATACEAVAKSINSLIVLFVIDCNGGMPIRGSTKTQAAGLYLKQHRPIWGSEPELHTAGPVLFFQKQGDSGLPNLLPFTRPVESGASGVLKLDRSGGRHYLIGR